ncbi:glycosyl hydrolases family 31-domain-containing protein [Dichomitus squalens]|uniref:Glucosidase II subunit alpha n=1 Tax=Dichomitus squalens TaxID=114155 RepID=A0A4Q9PDL5_9APHY|nr:glycosyl hydrolases family 31-domain-containing protein [Dichomitus squalens]
MRTVGFLFVLAATPATLAFKSQDFKTCSQAGFCRCGRALSVMIRAAQSPSWTSPYAVDASSAALSRDQTSFTAAIRSSIYPDVKFGLDVRIHDDGVVRVRMDEVDGFRKHYDEAHQLGRDGVSAVYGAEKEVEVKVAFEPLKVTLLRNGKEQVVLNNRGLLHMEHFRTKEFVAKGKGRFDTDGSAQVVLNNHPRIAWFEGEEEDGWWEETFRSFVDCKPRGPESLLIDIDFANHGHVYGIAQHATRLDLPTTTGENAYYSDPYRLYNADVFEYLNSTVVVFNAVGSDTFIDIGHPISKSSTSHWISETGILDVFIIPGLTPAGIFAQYTRLTGTPALPAQWALGYHQCRWAYVSSDDVRTVQKRFDEADMPVDVLWLDIEHAEEHKYFIWDKRHFPDPVDMIKDVEAVGRHMVVIVDPHLKRTNDYPVYKQAAELGILIKNGDGTTDYEGWRWSGSSAWADFFNPRTWDCTVDTGIWNDMNEPAVFNGPEISMPRDNIHYGGWEHRDLHNIKEMLFHNLTSQAAMARTDPPERPFVLSRSFYAEHMAVGVKMVLANNIAGFSFAGSDVGGYFGNPDSEMLVRWYGVGVFSPFFRAHAHVDATRREPFLLHEPYKSIVRDMLRLRYAMLPVYVTGLPVVRPHFVVFPQDEEGFSLDDQFFVGGSGLSVKPVARKGATEEIVYLPAEDQVYYDYFNDHAYRSSSSKGKLITVPAELHQIPVFVRGGSIIPTRERPRRSSPLMKHDPFTLRVALGSDGSARGELYLDDGETYSHQQGQFVWREFAVEKPAKKSRCVWISSRDLAAQKPAEAVDRVALAAYDSGNDFAKSIADVRVEKYVHRSSFPPPSTMTLDGFAGRPTTTITAGVASADKKEGTASVLVIRDPKVAVTSDWAILVQA